MVSQQADRDSLILCEGGRRLLAAGGCRTPYFNRHNGYWYLTVGGRSKSLHRYLSETLIPNPHGYPCVNHLNSNKEDNSLSNLEWCTQSHNIKHAFDTGRKLPTKAWTGKRGRNHNRSVPVVAIHTVTGERIAFGSQHLANDAGFSNKCISLALNGKIKTHKGYQWFRAEVSSNQPTS